MNDHISGEDLAAYADGLLNADKKSELESHFSRCPACLDELAEITAVMRRREKIPARFLKVALGEKSKNPKSVLRLRLVFEIAAAFVVVVFIGYLFLGGNRFWQNSERQKPSVVMDENVRLADTSTAVRDEEIAPLQAERRDRADARKTNNERAFPAPEKESLSKKKLARNATIHETVGEVQMDSAAKDQLAAEVMEKNVNDVEQSLGRQKKSGAGAVPPIAAKAKEGNLKEEEEFSLRSAVTVPATGTVAQPAGAEKKQDAALTGKEISDKKMLPPFRIEGDAVWTDLRNPELLSDWPWFQKDLTLELQIDGAGTVIAVVPLGEIDPLLAKLAENEAKKLLFSVSKKKSRRARLIANESPPNPAELRSPRKGG